MVVDAAACREAAVIVVVGEAEFRMGQHRHGKEMGTGHCVDMYRQGEIQKPRWDLPTAQVGRGEDTVSQASGQRGGKRGREDRGARDRREERGRVRANVKSDR